MAAVGGQVSQPDVIVVGAGPAGTVIARRLASAGAEVLVLDAGPDTRALSPLAASTLPLSADDPRARPIAARGRADEAVSVWRGQGPGGSGAINGAAWTPAPAEVIAAWPGFGTQRYSAGLARAEAVMAPVAVTTSPLAEHLAAALGAPVAPGRLTVDERGRRRNPWQTYDPESTGARLRCNARVRSLLLSPSSFPRGEPSTHVEGVVLDDGGELRAQDVVLAAGAIDTARLLHRAAADPARGMTTTLARTLRSAGCDGREHPEVLLDVPAGLRALLPAVPVGILGARIPLTIAGRRIEVRAYEAAFHTAIPGLPVMAPQIGIALLDPHSVSTVGEADVHLSSCPDASDREALDAGADLVVRALSTLQGRDGGEGDGHVRRHTGYSQHLYATAAMGRVTDGGGRIDGLAGVRVADGSLLPPGLGAGPYASVFAVAEAIAADMLAG